MTERLLQFIWQMQYFNRGELMTTRGEPVDIISPGLYNQNQGPDFYDARIRIGETIWAGTVELHLQTSGWDKHGHSADKNFQNVILHVVWENDIADHPLPLLELKERVPKILLSRYGELLRSPAFIPCEKTIGKTDPMVLLHWKDRLLAERIERKAGSISLMLSEGRNNWQELYWCLLARNFGHSVNSDAFEMLARSIGINLLSRHAGQMHQLESLLLGQAGLLDGEFHDAYPTMLQKEYQFLGKKYGLKPVTMPIHFLRMRPANFPTIRLAQLAMLIYEGGHSLEVIREEEDLKKIRKRFEVAANDYWLTHYLPDKPSAHSEKKIGDSMFGNILINTIVPFLFSYGCYHDKGVYKEKAFRWLTETGTESNSIVSGFMKAGIRSAHAGDSQALIELKTQYCDAKRCLDCNIGNALLRDSS